MGLSCHLIAVISIKQSGVFQFYFLNINEIIEGRTCCVIVLFCIEHVEVGVADGIRIKVDESIFEDASAHHYFFLLQELFRIDHHDEIVDVGQCV